MFDRRTAIVGAGATVLLKATRTSAQSRSHNVAMLTQDPATGARMVFSPRILRVAEADTVTFKPTQPTHSCISTPGMIPEGAQGWRGQIGKPVTVTFTKPGYYGYHCLPHRSLGMVGLVIVHGEGHDADVAAAKAVKQPGKAARVWEDIWREVGV